MKQDKILIQNDTLTPALTAAHSQQLRHGNALSVHPPPKG